MIEKIKIAVPNELEIYKLLIQNYLENSLDKSSENNPNNDVNFEIIMTDEKNVLNLLEKDKVDIALLNPIQYGKGVKKGDFSIIPANVLSLYGYTEIMNIYFKPRLINIKKILVESKESYLSKLSLLLLKEKFDIDGEIGEINDRNILETWQNKFDCLIHQDINDDSLVRMDVGEEWDLLCEQPLPLLIWVTKQNNKKIVNLESTKNQLNLLSKPVNSIINKNFNENSNDISIDITDINEKDKSKRRVGKISATWNDEIEEAINFTLEFLFYHQVFTVIPSLKIFGQDNPKITISKGNLLKGNPKFRQSNISDEESLKENIIDDILFKTQNISDEDIDKDYNDVNNEDDNYNNKDTYNDDY